MTDIEATPLIRRISMNIVLVSDLERSVEFYRDKLGLRLITRTSEWAEFEAGETHLALQVGGDPQAPRSNSAAGKLTISFEVDDVVEAHERLAARGVPFTQQPAEQDFGFLAVLSDPDGLEILLFERRS
jgi:catechol 2,3-dioxygenase-like lactoylglutathione lyase family enzyme